MSTGSRLIPEVKQRRAESVPGWVTAWEHSVPYASFCPNSPASLHSPHSLHPHTRSPSADSSHSFQIPGLQRAIHALLVRGKRLLVTTQQSAVILLISLLDSRGQSNSEVSFTHAGSQRSDARTGGPCCWLACRSCDAGRSPVSLPLVSRVACLEPPTQGSVSEGTRRTGRWSLA